MTPAEVASLLTGFARTCQQQMFTEGQFRRDLDATYARLQGAGLVICARVDVDRGVDGFETIAEYGGLRRQQIDALGSNIHNEGSYRFIIDGWCNPEAESFDVSRSRDMYQAAFPPLGSLLTEHWGKRDTMTLLPRYADSGQRQRLERAIRDASLSGGPVTAVHTDLDLFKKINLEFGEAGGDAVLREFGTRLRQSFGEDCIAVRKGGEEFTIFFPSSGLGGVLPRLEQFRQMMASTNFAHINRANTCSSGIASFPLHVQTPNPPKELADALLDLNQACA